MELQDQTMVEKVKKSKDLEIVRKGNSLYLRFQGGGELPEYLKGVYTSYPIAMRDIEKYKSLKGKE